MIRWHNRNKKRIYNWRDYNDTNDYCKYLKENIFHNFLSLICNSLAKNMMMSGLVLILTQGGPQGSTETMISFMYKQSVNNLNYNDAYAAAVIAFILTGIAMAVSFSFEKKGVHYT